MKSRSKVIIGSMLVLSGALSLIGNLNILSENFVLPILGAAFLFAYFILGSRKKYSNIGFLIPGIILPGLQILKFADDNNMGENAEIAIAFGVLSVSFLAVYLIHSFWFKQLSRGKRNWPLHVSIILVLFGGMAYAVECYNWKFGAVIISNIWPAILVFIGVRMLYKTLKASKQKLDDQN